MIAHTQINCLAAVGTAQITHDEGKQVSCQRHDVIRAQLLVQSSGGGANRQQALFLYTSKRKRPPSSLPRWISARCLHSKQFPLDPVSLDRAPRYLMNTYD